MSTNRAKFYDDPNIWGAKNNAFQDALKKGEYIELAANGNEVPTVKQYTRFSWYNTESTTISSAQITGDNEYSAGASITNPISEAIFEDSADVTLTWGDTIRGQTLPSISDNTWYIYCVGNYDNSSSTIGQGSYNVTTSAPTYDFQKGGWYQGTNRVIGEFVVASSVVGDIVEYNEINNLIKYQSNGDVELTNNLDVGNDLTVIKDLIVNGTFNNPLNIKTLTDTSYTILDDDGYNVIEITQTTSGGTSTITLPTVADNTGREIFIKLDQQSTGYADYVIIDGEGAETIEGDTVWHLNGEGDFLGIYSNGTEWKILDFQASYVVNGGTLISRTDWTSVYIGSNTSLNVNSNITHNLGCDLLKLECHFLISEDSTITANTFRATINERSSGYGCTLYNVSSSALRFQVSTSGIPRITLTPSTQVITSSSYYYGIKIFRTII